MARAAPTGMVMVRGECLPLAGMLPLLPVRDALGELARLDGGGLLAAALDAAPGYVREEVARLLPGMGQDGGTGPAGRDGEWSRQRLFAGVAELLAAVAGGSPSGVGLVVEDVHWADGETLDFLTFLVRAGRRGPMRVVATCRGDEAPLAEHVAGWLARVRGDAGTEEIRLGPLSRAEVAGQAAALAGGPVSPQMVGELFARAEGNAFFTEQLVAAALAGQGGTEGGLQVPAELPARLAELLAARAGRCAGDARAVLAGLAVAGRSLGEDLLAAVTGLEVEAVRRGLRELAAARLLAEDTTGGGHRPRHALLAEAVAAGLLPGERAVLHERAARALAGDPALAAEVAGHWQAAGRPAEELLARVSAAEAAERVFGYDEAAVYWQRASELCQVQPEAAAAAGIDVPRLSVRAIDAFFRSGDSVRAGLAAEEAYRRFAGHADPATAAVVCHRAAYFRAIDAPTTGLPLMEEALRLFEQAPSSFDYADALLDYATIFLLFAEGRPQASRTALDRALEIAEAVGAMALIPRVLASLAAVAFVSGQVEDGLAALERGWALARAAREGPALVWLAVNESDALLKLAQFQRAADVASLGLDAARQAGLEAWEMVGVVAANAAEALLAVGRTAEAAALINPLTAGPPDRDRWLAHVTRAELDLLRGDTGAAAGRWQLDLCFPLPPQQSRLRLRVGAKVRGGLAVGGTPGRCPPGDPAGARPVQGHGPDHFGRAAAGGGHAGLRRPGRAGPGAPRRPRHHCCCGRRRWPDHVGGADGWCPVRRPPVRGQHPGLARYLGRRADPGGRAGRLGCVGRRGESLAGPELPAPGRVRAGGGRPRRSWTPGSRPRRRPARCAPPRPPPTGTPPCWPRSAPWPNGPGSRCTRRPPANPKPRRRPSR